MKVIENFFIKNDLMVSDQETFFVYDLDKVDHNVKTLRKLFPKMDNIYFSVKSNPSPTLLKKLSDLGVCFDVSSALEMTAAYMACSDYSRITVSGPAKTDAFINRFSNLNLKSVHIDSIEEYEILKDTNVNLSVRWPLESGYSQKVGLPKADLETIVKSTASSKMLSGIHIYIGRERAQGDIVSTTLDEIKKFVKKHPKAFIEKPNLYWGAGLPLVNHVETDFFPNDPFFSINLECGRALVHDAGYYVTQILEVKEKPNEKLVILNGGLQHLATHFGSPRFGQDDVSIFFPKSNTSDTTNVNVYGSLGTTTDLLLRNVSMPSDVKRGDWIAIGPAGGYGYSAGTNQFLGPHSVREVFIQGTDIKYIDPNTLNYLEAGVYETQNS